MMGDSGPTNSPPSDGNDSLPIRYRVRHQTSYRYSEVVAVCQNQIRMQPVTGGNLVCHRTVVDVEPIPKIIRSHRDYFGNLAQTFSIESIHESLTVTVRSEVSVTQPSYARQIAPVGWEICRDDVGDCSKPPFTREYRQRSPRINIRKQFADYAIKSFGVGKDVVAGALDLTQRIHADFAYDTTATDVHTSPEDVFVLKAGVCQDFSHVAIACLRSIGLPARYVSGYLRTLPPPGSERLIGADESHAWFEVYGGPMNGWIGMDPTNACLVDREHVPVCVGRDYDDVSPMRGVVLGGGVPVLKVEVDVEPIDEGDGLAKPPNAVAPR